MIGLHEKGMELWNPRSRKVKLLWGGTPLETDGFYGQQSAETFQVNDGSELNVYGGFNGSCTHEIWKYTFETSI